MSEHTRMASRNIAKVADPSTREHVRESTSLFVIAQMSIVIAEALETIAERQRPKVQRCSCQTLYGSNVR